MYTSVNYSPSTFHHMDAGYTICRYSSLLWLLWHVTLVRKIVHGPSNRDRSLILSLILIQRYYLPWGLFFKFIFILSQSLVAVRVTSALGRLFTSWCPSELNPHKNWYAFGVGYKLQTVVPTPCRVYYEWKCTLLISQDLAILFGFGNGVHVT